MGRSYFEVISDRAPEWEHRCRAIATNLRTSRRVSVKKVNIRSVALNDALDEAGFRHVATSVGVRLEAQRIGASVYQAEAGLPIWPYHYHHGIEEWLYVIAGTPVLREPAGERLLTPGDLVCFPSGHLGAHTLTGPGRLVIFAAGHDVEPYMSVYPDSDKVSGPGGILLRSGAVSYWYGEGTAGPSPPAEFEREPERSPSQPAVNALDLRAEAADPHAPTGFRYRAERLGPLLGSDRLDATVMDLDPGEGSEPYHYVYGREQWLLVMAATPTLLHPQGEDQLEAGDLVCLPEGPAGAHRLLNRGESVVRALFLSTTGLPANVCYPETGHWLIRNGPGRDEVVRTTA